MAARSCLGCGHDSRPAANFCPGCGRPRVGWWFLNIGNDAVPRHPRTINLVPKMVDEP